MTTPDDPHGLLGPYWYVDDPSGVPFDVWDRVRMRERLTQAFHEAADQAKAKREMTSRVIEPDDE